MRPPWPSTMPNGGLCRIGCTARLHCTRPMAASCPNSHRETMCAGSCRWCGRRSWPRTRVRRSIDGVAYTAGPGLIGALLVGAGFARSLAYAWGTPGDRHPPSGGPSAGAVAGDTGAGIPLSRAAGIGRAYPAGRCAPASATIAFSARRWTMPRARPSTRRPRCWGCPIRAARRSRAWPSRAAAAASTFPRPMLDRPGLDFSFSGLKTAALVALRGRALDDQARADVARGFQEAVVDTLAEKCEARARGDGPPATGGCRRRRRQPAPARAARRRGARRRRELYFPRTEFCTDNGAMIALAGCAALGARGSPGARVGCTGELGARSRHRGLVGLNG